MHTETVKSNEMNEQEMYQVDGGSWGCILATAGTAFSAATFNIPGCVFGGLEMLADC